jgi:hypothetical protein
MVLRRKCCPYGKKHDGANLILPDARGETIRGTYAMSITKIYNSRFRFSGRVPNVKSAYFLRMRKSLAYKKAAEEWNLSYKEKQGAATPCFLNLQDSPEKTLKGW